MNKEDKLKAYLDEYGSEILTSYSDQDKSSFEIYRENTADGYEVFVAKYSGITVCIYLMMFTIMKMT